MTVELSCLANEEAGRFLRCLDPHSDSFVFQTYPETVEAKAKAGGGKTISGYLVDVWDELVTLNADGSGVSVTVNELAGDRRRSDDVTRIRAVWHDEDAGVAKEFPLPPSMVVQTSPGRYHHYWQISDYWPADDDGRADFRAVMDAMVTDYGSDPQARDISRVMRLPGTLHMKDEPYLVRLVYPFGLKVQRYNRAEILAAFNVEQIPAAKARNRIETPSLVPDIDLEPASFDRVVSALEFIPSDTRDDWLNVGLALHHEWDGGRQARNIWDAWSKATTAGNFDAKEQNKAWFSFRSARTNPVTLGTLFRRAMENGWKDTRVDELPSLVSPELRIDIERYPGDLAERAIAAVRTFLADGDKSRPSETQFAGMGEIAKVIQAMADGDPVLNRDFLLSFLSPGIGKTVTVTETVRTLVATPEYDHVGVVVFVSKVDEIAKLITGMRLSEADFSTFVSKNYRDKVPLGNPVPGKARVLFTTQQMLEAHLNGRERFADIEAFHFEGKPRQVRIWDEAILPSKIHTLGLFDISRLYGGLAKISEAAHRTAQQLFADLQDKADKDTILMPDMEQFGYGMDEAAARFKYDEDREAIEALWKLSGRVANVRRDKLGNAALGYNDIFPDDLGPLLVLDASGQLRQTTRFWHESRKNLVFLHSPAKRYDGLTIHHWDRGSGQDQFSRKSKSRHEIYQGIVRAIEAIPEDEKVLVVHFKEGGDTAAIEKELRAFFPWSERLRFCTWGRHTATNEFADCKHVILASVLQYRTSQNEAYGRSAKKLDPKDILTEDDFDGTRLGEIAHNIFQAACRCAVRRAEGDSCPPGCHLYVIFPTSRIPRSLLNHVFPGSTVTDWRPVYKVTGKKLRLATRLAELATVEGVTIRKADLHQHLGCTKQYLSTLLDDELSVYMNNEMDIEIEKQHHSLVVKSRMPAICIDSTDKDVISESGRQSNAFFIRGSLMEKQLLPSVPFLSSYTFSRQHLLTSNMNNTDDDLG